jgi:Flp pilus assembly protein TadB
VKIGRPRLRRGGPVLITDAQPSLEEQLAYRRRRYAITMGIRMVCLVVAAAFYHVVWLVVAAMVGAAVLPWAAVVMANDRLPRRAETFDRFAGTPDRALPPDSDRPPAAGT